MRNGIGCVTMGLIGFAALLAYGQTFGVLKDQFGERAADQAMLWIVGAAILLGVILAVRATIRARAAAAKIIRFDRDYPEEPGPFGRWFNGQSRFRNSDQMRVDDAVKVFLKAYGGRAVVGYLIREGYEGLIEADLLDVFDVDRAQRVGAGIYSATYRLPWWASLAALVTGGIIGYRATTRR